MRFVSRFDSLLGAFAWCALRRPFRPFLKRDVGFTACVCLEIDSLSGYFECAAFSLFGNKAPSGIRIPEDDAVVHHVRSGNSRMIPIISDLENRRSLFLYSSDAELPLTLRATSQVDVVTGEPNAALVRAAVYQFRGVRISDEDAAFLATLSIFDVAIALRSGMPVDAGIRALRKANPSTPACAVTEQTTPDEPPGTAIKLDLLKNLHGYGETVDWGLQLVRDLDDYRNRKISWDAVDRGVLLYGPPGTGKTKFASVLAEACGIDLFEGSYTAWQQAGHQGEALKAMRKTFEEARKRAPSIIVIDEIDSFVARGTGDRNDAYMRGIVNGLLECLDGLRSREGVVVVATTNKPEDVDDALLRSGRIDKHISITLPDADARISILESYLGVPIPVGVREDLARRTLNTSGADLEFQVRNAHRLARFRGETAAVEHLIEVLPALEKLPHDVTWSAVVHECGHLIAALAKNLNVSAVTINDSVSPIARMHQTGTVELEQKRFHRVTRATMEAHLVMLLSGMAAEREILGDHDVGASNSETSDLARATALATRLEVVHGMGETFLSEASGDDVYLSRIRQGMACCRFHGHRVMVFLVKPESLHAKTNIQPRV
jgi:DNA polymerase III delta prime subunit